MLFPSVVQTTVQYITWPEVEGPGKGSLDHGPGGLWGGTRFCVDSERDNGGCTNIGVYILLYGCVSYEQVFKNIG